MRKYRLLTLLCAAVLAVTVTSCSDSGSDSESDLHSSHGSGFPITVEHAFGETTVDSADRIATVGWGNQEALLSLGVVPVGMAKVTWGDDDGDGVLPWVEDKLAQLGAQTPALWDETDGPDFEAVANVSPDLIVASYSGLTKEQYDTLSKIAPVVAYPSVPWGTTLQQMVSITAKAIGRADDGATLNADLKSQVDAAVATHPELKGTKTMFAYIEPTDLSKIGYYTVTDPRAAFLKGAGLGVPSAVQAGTDASPKEFYLQVSSEQADQFDDVGLIVTYGDDGTLAKLQADPLLGKIPAVKAGHVAVLQNDTPLGASSNPSPLSIPWGIGKYMDALAAALKS